MTRDLAAWTPSGRALELVRLAKRARKDHQDECAKWDYENTNCEECDQHDAKVRAARDRLRKTIARESGGRS